MALTVSVKPETEKWLQEEALREGGFKGDGRGCLLGSYWATVRRTTPDADEEAELLT